MKVQCVFYAVIWRRKYSVSASLSARVSGSSTTPYSIFAAAIEIILSGGVLKSMLAIEVNKKSMLSSLIL